MKERPILFSGQMVRAILGGRKTQTRRVVKPHPPAPGVVRSIAGQEYSLFTDRRSVDAWRVAGSVGVVRDLMGAEYPEDGRWRCPYGVPGDRLWVKEAIRCVSDPSDDLCASVYVADGADTVADAWPWKPRVLPGMFMPRGLARIWLEVKGVRVERLQDISEEDAAAEGVDPMVVLPGDVLSHTAAFGMLWDSINHKSAPWDSNPWVWVVEFERVSP